MNRVVREKEAGFQVKPGMTTKFVTPFVLLCNKCHIYGSKFPTKPEFVLQGYWNYLTL